MVERPNKKALTDALDIYRDAMRPFIIRCLKRIPGKRVEDRIRVALRDDQYERFIQNVDQGRSIEESIDIGNFPRLVRFYWREVFRGAFRPDSEARDALQAIADARNTASHPEGQHIELQYTLDRLNDIAGVLAEINEPEYSRTVEGIRSGLTPFRTPAHKFRQGGRDVYAFAIDLETLDKLLPDRVDDRVVKDANRPLTPAHAKRIQKYLEERSDWLLGTLLLGISPDDVDYRPYPSATGTVGELIISSNSASKMKMFDGQHRRRAIKDVLGALSHSPIHSWKLSSLREASLPIMLYQEDRIEALRQMFADAAQTKAIERNAVTRFDQTDAFNLAAMWVAENSDLFAGRVEMERASVARSSHSIIAVNQLAMALKTLEVGYKGRVSNNRNEEYMIDIESLYDRCWAWADDFMPTAREEYNDLMAGEIDNSEIPEKRAGTMAYNATVIRILAGCYYEWTKNDDEWGPLAEFLRGASLEPGAIRGSLLVDAGVVAPGGISPAGQRWQLVEGVDYIVRRAREIV